jgi:hypothetical protein
MLIKFSKGELPWQRHAQKENGAERREAIAQAKIATSPDVLCDGLPEEFRILLEHVKKLRYDEQPKYAWFRRALSDLMVKKGMTYDGIFDWDENAAIHRPLPSTFLMYAATEFQRDHERQMKDRCEKVFLPAPREMFTFAWAK